MQNRNPEKQKTRWALMRIDCVVYLVCAFLVFFIYNINSSEVPSHTVGIMYVLVGLVCVCISRSAFKVYR